jgi:hypothetical protein
VARSAGHRFKHDSRMLDWPLRPVGTVNVFILAAQLFALIHSLLAMFVPVDVIFQEIHGDTSWGGNIASK